MADSFRGLGSTSTVLIFSSTRSPSLITSHRMESGRASIMSRGIEVTDRGNNIPLFSVLVIQNSQSCQLGNNGY